MFISSYLAYCFGLKLILEQLRLSSIYLGQFERCFCSLLKDKPASFGNILFDLVPKDTKKFNISGIFYNKRGTPFA
jgi:hypothetical protein